MRSIELLVILQFLASVHSSHVQDAKSRIRQEIRHELGGDHLPPPIPTHQHHHHRFSLRRDPRKATHIFHQKPRRFSHRKRLGAYYTPWTGWTKCNSRCRQTRERYCKVRRRCGEIKHLEERICDRCHVEYHDHSQPYVDHRPHKYVTSHRSYHLPVYEEIDEHQDDDRDYYVLKKRYKKKRQPIVIEVEDYQDLEDEDDFADRKYNKNFVKSIRTKDWNNQYYRDDVYQSSVEEFDNIDRSDPGDPADQGKQPGDPGEGVKLNQFGLGFDEDDDGGAIDRPQLFEGNDNNNEYEDDDEEDRSSQLRNETIKSPPMEKAVFEVPRRRKRIYSRWSKWSKCSPKCTTRRYKKCRIKRICGKEVLREIAYCYTEGSFCQQWLEGQVQKTQAYNPRPMAQNRKDVLSPNAIANDYILSGKGYRAPEYTPLKLKCGIPMIRNGRRNMYNMLKIIGGRTSRKGQWPWQVVIFNRFREAFCGGTLIAPNWILTAAHCVRKVLYVRLGEHNLDNQDGTEVDYRVLKSIKHPNYDKKTVDSDVALLRLPEPVNATNWIGFACMPRPYQPLPKNVQCTVIGWGKRRNNDQAGTSVLHQAEVPIIPMENCKAVYYDYTITKNMFCAGHKRGRIDTCAGDSGGPLLCRDMTKPNHPWTIFGITSFGDGCAKKNKFGIYAKVPNYVDWVWSVVNCNGNCKSNYSRL